MPNKTIEHIRLQFRVFNIQLNCLSFVTWCLEFFVIVSNSGWCVMLGVWLNYQLGASRKSNMDCQMEPSLTSQLSPKPGRQSVLPYPFKFQLNGRKVFVELIWENIGWLQRQWCRELFLQIPKMATGDWATKYTRSSVLFHRYRSDDLVPFWLSGKTICQVSAMMLLNAFESQLDFEEVTFVLLSNCLNCWLAELHIISYISQYSHR